MAGQRRGVREKNQIRAATEIAASNSIPFEVVVSAHARDDAGGKGNTLMNTEAHDLQREALSIGEVCRVSGIGRTKIYEAISTGRLKARKLGKRTLVLRADLQAFLASLPVVRADA
jgi:excisionase family DNA binding protein